MNKEGCCNIFRCPCRCRMRDKVYMHVITQFKSIDLLALEWGDNDKLAVQLDNGNQLIVTRGDIFTNHGWDNGYYVAVYYNSKRRTPNYIFSYPTYELGLEEHFGF